MSPEHTSLQIDSIAIGEYGAIGMCACPGRNQESAQDSAWRCDLKKDAITIDDWRPDYLLTLLESHEFEILGVPQFPEFCKRSNFQWLHFPIPDLHSPDANNVEAWRAMVGLLVDKLKLGKRVLIHCAAGRGRTGTVAAALMIEMGWDVRDAISLVRKRRPGAIESDVQMDFLYKQARLAVNRP